MAEQPTPGDPRSEDLRSVYAEICKSYHGIDDFRARLLALLPIASGAGGLLILADKDTVKNFLGPIGIFGALITLGLFIFELRGIQKCNVLIKMGQAIETEMKVKSGPFRTYPRGHLNGVISAVTAAYVVYLTILAAWCYLAIVGFQN